MALCLAGAFISNLLLVKHMTGSSGFEWFEAGCSAGSDMRRAGCDGVLASPYSYWPVKKTGEPVDTPHIPVALLGLVYFSLLAVWLIGIGRPSHQRRWFHLVPLIWIIGGLVNSARYTYIMFALMDEWCPWCLATHLVNLVVAVCVTSLWPRAPKRVPADPAPDDPTEPDFQKADPPPETAPPPRFAEELPNPPFTRLGGTVAVAAIVVYAIYGHYALLNIPKTQDTLRRCIAAVTRIKGDPDGLVRNWQLAVVREIPSRPDDPIRTDAEPGRETMKLVVFSDFLCPTCRRFAKLLDEKIQPMFAGRLEIIFKHFPLDRRCNARLKRTVHRNACAAAYAAEVARQHGGGDAFWRVHDLLFARRTDAKSDGFDQLDAREIAGNMAIDPDEFVEDMRSVPVMSRVEEDIDLGRKLGVKGTPAIFVDGKRVDPLASLQLAFWDKVADEFWNGLSETRPASTRLDQPGITPSIPDPTAAP